MKKVLSLIAFLFFFSQNAIAKNIYFSSGISVADKITYFSAGIGVADRVIYYSAGISVADIVIYVSSYCSGADFKVLNSISNSYSSFNKADIKYSLFSLLNE